MVRRGRTFPLFKLRELPTPAEVSQLKEQYDQVLDLTMRMHEDVMKNSWRNEFHEAWNLVITDLQNRRAELLVQSEPELKRVGTIARAVQDVTDAFGNIEGEPTSTWQVSDPRVTNSLQKLYPLAEAHGYTVGVDDNLLVLEAHSIKISLGFMDRGQLGLGPSGAVKRIDVIAPDHEIVQYVGEWTGVACEPVLQRQIDRALAIFG